jgi:restriction endonuclease S subunit
MKLKDIVTFVSKSVVPQNGTTYNLYSLPSFDENKSAEVLDGAEIQSNKYDVPNKCILFNKLNVRFKRVWRINNSDSNKIASTEFLPLVVNEDVVDYQYCYYLLISDEITNYLCGQNSNTSGSHKRIYPQNFLNIDIHLPKMPIQKTIGKTLSDIDSKIELNKRINDNLEAMAKQLYDYWFVQFDFPNEEGKPYKSSGGAMVWNKKLKREIPSCFEVVNMGKLCDFRNGINYSKDETGNDYQIVNVRNINSSLKFEIMAKQLYVASQRVL